MRRIFYVFLLGLLSTGLFAQQRMVPLHQVAGIMAAKRTPDLIPMCHTLQLEGVDLNLSLNPESCSVDIIAEVRCEGRTGVEMEALTSAGVAALTVYDMCKAVQRDIVISDLRLEAKTGGIHGDFVREGE